MLFSAGILCHRCFEHFSGIAISQRGRPELETSSLHGLVALCLPIWWAGRRSGEASPLRSVASRNTQTSRRCMATCSADSPRMRTDLENSRSDSLTCSECLGKYSSCLETIQFAQSSPSVVLAQFSASRDAIICRLPQNLLALAYRQV